MSTRSLLQHRGNGTAAATHTLRSLGARRDGFSTLLTSKLYRTFIRPKFEYALAICRMNSAELTILQRIQHKNLRILMGGHPTASTKVFKHVCNLPWVEERRDVLVTKFCLKASTLPPNCLLIQLQPLLSSSCIQYLKLNPLYRRTINTLQPQPFPSIVEAHRMDLLHRRRSDQILLRACRPTLAIDSILTIPATKTERSRLLRWRMNWLQGRK